MMMIRAHCYSQPVASLGRLPSGGHAPSPVEGACFHSIPDFFSGALPAVGMFAHVENLESMVSFPKGDAVYRSMGRASVETCQAGVRANLVGTAAVAGAALLSGLGLASAALPLAGVGVGALLVSGATNVFTRHQMSSAAD